MKKEEFDIVKSNLQKLIDQCRAEKDKIDIVGGFENLAIKEANRSIINAKNFKSKMDKVLMGELYHLIGMGNLSVTQTQTLCSMIKDLCSYRYLIECLAAMNPLTFTGKQNSKYNCNVLGIKFVAKDEAEEE